MARPERRRLAGAFFVLLVGVATAVVVRSAPAQADPLITCPETPIIHQVCSVGTAAPNVLADGADAVAGGIFDQATKWVVAGARSVVGFIGQSIDDSTRPDVNASWFEPNYRLMVQVGVAFLLPLLIIAALWSLLRHDADGALKIVTVKLPVAAMGMVVVTWIVNLLVVITDNLSAFVGSTIGGSGTKFATGVVHLMEAFVLTGNGLGGFLGFLIALIIALCALLLWMELVVRQAAVLVATLFMPVAFAGMVWESTSHWLRKLAEGLLAFILAKFVITAIVAVGANAIASGGDNPAALILGAGILAVAVFTPYVLLSIIPLGTLAVTEGLTRRPLQAGTSGLSTLYWGQSLLGGGGRGAPEAAPAPGGGPGAPPAAGGLPSAGGAEAGGGAGGAGPGGGGAGGAGGGAPGGAGVGGGSGGAGVGGGSAGAGVGASSGGAAGGAGAGGAAAGGAGAGAAAGAGAGAGAGAAALPVAGTGAAAQAGSQAGQAAVSTAAGGAGG